jgi:hypothetical protein
MMVSAEPEGGRGRDPMAADAQRHGRDGGSRRGDPARDQSADRYANPEAALGGADAVEKTTYVVGEGTEPGARPRGEYVARGAADRPSVAVWIVGGIAVLIALVYVIGIFR